MRRRTAVHFAACLVLAGCGTATTVGVGGRPVSFDSVVETVDRNQDALESLTGEGEIRVVTPSFSQTADFTLRLRKPDSLLVSVTGPFGIRVATALLTRERFEAYSVLQNTVFSGAPTRENLRKALRIDLSFDDLLTMFTGGRVLEGDRRTPDEALTEGSDAVYAFRTDHTTRRYLVDPSTLLLHKVQLLDDRGTLTFEQTYADHRTDSGVTLPRLITVTQPSRRQIITLKYDVLTPNAAGISFPFTFPQNARRVEWQ